MGEGWTLNTVAEELLRFTNDLRRFMAQHIQSVESEVDETTLIQVGTLMRLIEQPATVSELAKERKVSLQSVSVHIQSLVERGWVVRQPDPNDRRRSLLEVTPAGMASAQAVQRHLKQGLTCALDGLTEEEIAAAQVFLPALRRVIMGQSDTHAEPQPDGKPQSVE